ncbi:MAG: GNAT family N-acetyltransferase [Verrucomicrobia bacterium]|nr:GNAT family N-acetyltransferase [Verrucomicrobiota bacterium]
MIRPATHADAEAIVRIYNHYIEETVITFEETAIDAAEIVSRMGNLDSGFPWLVCEEEGAIIGYAYVFPWRTRAAYRHTAEASVYLEHTRRGQGTGTALYRQLIETATLRGLHILIGGITLPNPASIALHERLGFEKVAHFTEVGRKFDQWLDVGFWQLTLPRHS